MKKLGTLLQEAGVIDEIQLVRALSHHRKWRCRLGQSLVELGFVNEETIAKTIAGQLELPYVDLDPSGTPGELLELLPKKLAEEKIFFPVGYSHSDPDKAMVVAFSDPTDSALVNALANQAGVRIEPVVARDSVIESAVRNWSKYCPRSASSGPQEQAAGPGRGPAAEAGDEAAGAVDLNRPEREPPEAASPEQELLSVSELPPIEGGGSGEEEMEVEHTAAWEQVMPDVETYSPPPMPGEGELPAVASGGQLDESMPQDLPSTDESAAESAPQDIKPSPAETFAASPTPPPEMKRTQETGRADSSSEAPVGDKAAAREESRGTSGGKSDAPDGESASNERILMEIKGLREEIVQLTMLVESLVDKEGKK